MTINPKDPQYLKEESVRHELLRVWNICHGCRLCFNLCPSFSELFRFIDDKGDAEVKGLTKAELNEVTDLCYQCKLCYIKCPYTPPHAWNVDVPRMLMRHKAQRVKQEGTSIQDRFLGNPDFSGKVACRMSSFANWANRNPLSRRVMEMVVGVHRERNLPDFAGQTFADWFRARKHPLKGDKKVALFSTCFVNYHALEQGIATVNVLEKNGYEILLPRQVCCGMPFLDGGDVESATRNMEQNVEGFRDIAGAGVPIVAPGPTCSYVLKNELAFYTRTPAAEKIGKQTRDLSEFLVELKNSKQLNHEFIYTPSTRIAYQIPCHLRAQNIGYKSMEILRTVPNVKVELVENCSAMDGTWGMKKQFFQLSIKQASKMFRGVNQAEPDQVCTDCPLSALQIEYGTGKKPVHPVQILDRAYQGDHHE